MKSELGFRSPVLLQLENETMNGLASETSAAENYVNFCRLLGRDRYRTLCRFLAAPVISAALLRSAADAAGVVLTDETPPPLRELNSSFGLSTLVTPKLLEVLLGPSNEILNVARSPKGTPSGTNTSDFLAAVEAYEAPPFLIFPPSFRPLIDALKNNKGLNTREELSEFLGIDLKILGSKLNKIYVELDINKLPPSRRGRFELLLKTLRDEDCPSIEFSDRRVTRRHALPDSPLSLELTTDDSTDTLSFGGGTKKIWITQARRNGEVETRTGNAVINLDGTFIYLTRPPEEYNEDKTIVRRANFLRRHGIRFDEASDDLQREVNSAIILAYRSSLDEKFRKEIELDISEWAMMLAAKNESIGRALYYDKSPFGTAIATVVSKALERYDPQHHSQADLHSYLLTHIQYEILEIRRESHEVNRSVQDRLRLLEEQGVSISGAVDYAVVSDVLGISEQHVANLVRASHIANASRIGHLEQLLTENNGAGGNIFEFSQATSVFDGARTDDDPESLVVRNFEIEMVNGLMSKLKAEDERLHRIVWSYQDQEMTFREIAQIERVSESRIYQLYHEGINKMKGYVRRLGIELEAD